MRQLRAIAALLVACSSPGGSSVTSSEATSSSSSAVASGPAASARPPSSWGAFPTAARRDSAPPGMRAAIAAVGATAPSLDVALTDGTRFDVASALKKHSHVVLIAWPALFIIGRDQKITHTATLDTYKERTTVAAILEKL